MSTYKTTETLAFLLLLCLPSIAAADREDWYFLASIGIADHNHPGELDSAFNEAESLPGVDRYEFSYDLLGFYWPLAEQNTIAGFVINSSSDT